MYIASFGRALLHGKMLEWYLGICYKTIESLVFPGWVRCPIRLKYP